MKYLILVILISLTGCATTEMAETTLTQKELAPHVWSDHKILSSSVAACSLKGEAILESLGFSHVVRNGNFVYGNFSSNRAAVKCVAVGETTFVYAAVAGPKVELVEKLRNEIIWQL